MSHTEEDPHKRREDAVKRRYKEFIDLLPMTLAIAGLSENPGPRSYSSEQMEARAQVLQSAFKVAKQTIRDVVKGGSSSKPS